MADSIEPVTEARQSLARGVSWLLASKVVSFAITTILPFVLSRRLPLTEYGYYKQLFVILTTGLNLLPLGMNMSLFYFIPRAKTQSEKGNIVLNVVIFYLAATGIAGGALIVHPAFIAQLFHSDPLTVIGRQIGVVLIAYVVSPLVEVILIANGDARLSAISSVMVTIARTSMILGSALIWGTVFSILWSVFIVSSLQIVWMAYYVTTRFRGFWRSFRWSVLRSQLIYATPLGLGGLLWSLQVDIDNYFVSYYFNAAALAIYATGCFDVPVVGMLSDSVGAMLIPRISELQAGNARAEIVALTVKAMRGLAFAYAPTFVFVWLAATQVITVLFSQKFLASVPVFRVNLLMVLLAIVAVDPVVRAYKSEHMWMMRINTALLVALMILLYYATPRFGLVGAVASVMFVQYVARAIFVWRISRLLRPHWADLRPLADVLKTLLSAAVAGLCIFPLLEPIQKWGAWTSVLSCGVIFMGIYIAGILLLKVPSQSEIDWFLASTVGMIKNRLPGWMAV